MAGCGLYEGHTKVGEHPSSMGLKSMSSVCVSLIVRKYVIMVIQGNHYMYTLACQLVSQLASKNTWGIQFGCHKHQCVRCVKISGHKLAPKRRVSAQKQYDMRASTAPICWGPHSEIVYLMY